MQALYNLSFFPIDNADWGMNAIHGVQSSCVKDTDGTVYCPTSFPNPVNFGTTFNDSLALEMGAIIATETRALWLAGATEESAWSGRPVIGLTAWSPNINLARKWLLFRLLRVTSRVIPFVTHAAHAERRRRGDAQRRRFVA